jgi:hypothetical protein
VPALGFVRPGDISGGCDLKILFGDRGDRVGLAAEDSTDRPSPLPTFLIIGAQKSATRWLRSNLGRHPDVHVAPAEVGYFNNRRRLAEGPDWYRSQFRGWQGEPCIGEACPSYLFWPDDPERIAGAIHDLVPDVRLLAILRNPIDRADSALLHHIARGRLPRTTTLVGHARDVDPEADPLGIVSGGWYAASLEPYLETFGEQLLVLLHDDLAVDVVGLYRRSAQHVGADPGHVPSGLDAVVRSNRVSLLERVRTGRSVRRRAPRRPLTGTDRRAMFAYYRDDVARLETMIGRDLSAWDPARDDRHRPDPR